MKCNTHQRLPQELELAFHNLLSKGRDQEYLELIAGVQKALEAARLDIAQRIQAAGGRLPHNAGRMN
jgi:hypothetical protein